MLALFSYLNSKACNKIFLAILLKGEICTSIDKTIKVFINTKIFILSTINKKIFYKSFLTTGPIYFLGIHL